MRDALLGADQRHDLGERIHRIAEPFLHPGAHCLAKRHEAETKAVATHRRFLGGVVQGREYGGRGDEIGVPRTKIDDVEPALE